MSIDVLDECLNSVLARIAQLGIGSPGFPGSPKNVQRRVDIDDPAGEDRTDGPGGKFDAVGPEKAAGSLLNRVGDRFRKYERAGMHIELGPELEQGPNELVDRHDAARA